MSEIAEIRKLFQDLIAPDLKSVATELSAFRTNVDHQFKNIKELVEVQFDAREAVEDARYTAVIAKIDAIRIEFAAAEAKHVKRHEDILKALDIEKRLEKVEARQAAGTAV